MRLHVQVSEEAVQHCRQRYLKTVIVVGDVDLWMALHGALDKDVPHAATTVSSDSLPTQTISNGEYDVDTRTATYVASTPCQYFGLLPAPYPHIWIVDMT